MKDVLAGTAGFIIAVVFSFLIPVATIAGGIWFYNDVIKDEPQTTSSYRDDVEVRQDYTPQRNVSDTIGYEGEQAFVNACATEAPRSTCQCMFNYFDSNMTNSEFYNLANSDNIESHPMTLKAVNACI